MTYSTNAARGGANFVDDRLGSASFLRRSLNKVFPDHWSFMLGEIAMYSFIILLLTGTYVALFFDASTVEVQYNGSYALLKGVTMSKAYASTLDISFDVRAGLLIRQIHHWAALMFLASISVHLCRVYFTGAFRKPREINWVIGVVLLILGIVEGFAGYSLPDDLLSGTGLRVAWSIVTSIPVVGTYVAFFLFGGEYPGDQIIPRLFIAHVFIIPLILLGLITAHLMILWHQKHTQFPGPGRTEHNVVGERVWPRFGAKTGGFFAIVFGVTAFLGGLVQINPIWLFGPYDPARVSAGSQPDWYMGWLDGALRLMPNWETRVWGHSISWVIFFPSVILPGLVFTGMMVYPWIESKFITKDREWHNLLQRPRDNPTRTAVGAMSIVFYCILWVSEENDIIAVKFDVSMNAITWFGRFGCIILPFVAYKITKKTCIALQHRDAERREHGRESGIITRLPHGEFVEVHVPLSQTAARKLTPDLAEALPLTPVESDHAEVTQHGEPGPAALNSGGGGGGREGSLLKASRSVTKFFGSKDDRQS